MVIVLVYYNKENTQNKQRINLDITKENIQTFFYEFPQGLELNEGIDYELFFEVFDNDGVFGSKKTKSKTFSYRKKTNEEV